METGLVLIGADAARHVQMSNFIVRLPYGGGMVVVVNRS